MLAAFPLAVLHAAAPAAAAPSGCAAQNSPAGSASLVEHDGGSTASFGTAHFSLEFDTATLALRNLTACDGGRSQGFMWPAGAGDIANGFSVWQLNYTDCTAAIPNGVRLDALGTPSSNRSYSVAELPTGGHRLSLRWGGVAVGPGAPAADVTVTVTMQPGSAEAALGASVVRHQPGMCIQALTLPNLRLILRDPADTLFVPWFFGQAGMAASDLPGWSGLELWRHPTVAVNGQLPLMPSAGGDSASMQWMATYSTAAGAAPLGLYVGAHSPDARLMLMLMESGTYSTAVQLVHLPDDLSDNTTTPWSLPFEVVLAGYIGDWWDAAQIYRCLGRAAELRGARGAAQPCILLGPTCGPSA